MAGAVGKDVLPPLGVCQGNGAGSLRGVGWALLPRPIACAPVALEVLDEGGTEVARGLVAAVQGHVLAEEVSWFVGHANGLAVRALADHAAACQRGRRALMKLVAPRGRVTVGEVGSKAL